jgi:Kef-type K+ transport system membrane component KefB
MHEGFIGLFIILGVSVFWGILGAWGFRKMHIPQVVGYIAIGLLIGESGFKLIRMADITALQPFNLFALGIIGFLVGGEIHISTLKKYAKQFTAILIGEGVTAFLLVGLSSFTVLWLVTHNFNTALAGGIVLGAIASATDPASTIDVLWEYRSRGVLTTAVIAIVAMDDALAMILYGLGTSTAEILAGGGVSLGAQVLKISVELLGAVALGAVLALVLSFFLRWLHKPERSLSLALGMILLSVGFAEWAGMDVIMATMTLGFVLANVVPRRSRELFKVIRNFSIPIYVVFFVFVGARLSLSNMPSWLWGIVGLYVLFRSVGKISGAWLGAKVTNSEPVVRKYLGTSLFAQGGVAVGLSIMASQHMQHIMVTDSMALGDMIIFTVTATTLIVQVIGPVFVKWSIKSSGEAGRNVTEEDVIEELLVKNVMDTPVVTVPESESVRRIVALFSVHDQMIYPVTNKENRVIGTISPDELKDVLSDQSSWEWLLAADVMIDAEDYVIQNAPLADTLQKMRDLQLEQLTVVEGEDDLRSVGMLISHQVRKRIAEEIFSRQQNK